MNNQPINPGCPNCGCTQFEKDWMHYARIKNLILCVCTLGVWYVWLILKQIVKGCPYRCVRCKKYLPW